MVAIREQTAVCAGHVVLEEFSGSGYYERFERSRL